MLPCTCPSCLSLLKVKSLKCDNCATEVAGSFELPVLARLTPSEQQFVVSFVKNSGSLKKMAAAMKLSYPTVRNILDELIQKIGTYEE